MWICLYWRFKECDYLVFIWSDYHSQYPLKIQLIILCCHSHEQFQYHFLFQGPLKCFISIYPPRYAAHLIIHWYFMQKYYFHAYLFICLLRRISDNFCDGLLFAFSRSHLHHKSLDTQKLYKWQNDWRKLKWAMKLGLCVYQVIWY